ncbi:hypothetical protein M426DRAFT_257034 [Hypoxylon sp. CI-4A]|nr:hypothetical protein M426DRAFT_257034 [Hypoxylon sp. CI-4A]
MPSNKRTVARQQGATESKRQKTVNEGTPTPTKTEDSKLGSTLHSEWKQNGRLRRKTVGLLAPTLLSPTDAKPLWGRDRWNRLLEHPILKQPNIHPLIPEGAYDHFTRKLALETGNGFPIEMLLKLDKNRQDRLVGGYKSRILLSSALGNNEKAFLVRTASPRCEDGIAYMVESTVGVSHDIDKANCHAMAYWSHMHPEYLCHGDLIYPENNKSLLRSVIDSPKNCKGMPFLEAESTGMEEFVDDYGARDCSAWLIDGDGCLQLLAVERMRSYTKTWVEVTEFLD